MRGTTAQKFEVGRTKDDCIHDDEHVGLRWAWGAVASQSVVANCALLAGDPNIACGSRTHTVTTLVTSGELYARLTST